MWSFCFSLHYRFYENILKTDCIDDITKFLNITSVPFVLPVLGVSGANPLWENSTGHNRGGSCVETKLRGQLGYEVQPDGLLDDPLQVYWRESLTIVYTFTDFVQTPNWANTRQRRYLLVPFLVLSFSWVSGSLLQNSVDKMLSRSLRSEREHYLLPLIDREKVPSFQFSTSSFPLQKLL